MISSQQTPQEWLWFLDQIPTIGSILEIGSYDGGSLLAWATSGKLVRNPLIRSIDFNDHGTGPKLQAVCESLLLQGYDAGCLLGNSHTDEAEEWAREWAPYDLVFIDGDHSYSGVREDYRRYSGMGRVVAFHDIGGHQPGCVRFWSELRDNRGGLKTLEYTAHRRHQIVEQGQQGIGIVFRMPIADQGPPAELVINQHTSEDDGEYSRGTWRRKA